MLRLLRKADRLKQEYRFQYEGGGMPLKSLMIKGKEYHANKITKIVMEEGTVSIMYIPNAMSRERER